MDWHLTKPVDLELLRTLLSRAAQRDAPAR
jgi:hypothetical protein